MPMPTTDKKEALGQAYVHAIAAKVGFNMAQSDKDFGLDGTIKDVVSTSTGRYHETGIAIEYQLKSSSKVKFENGKVIYDLESKNYNDLAGWDGIIPGILILFVMPKQEADWLDWSTNELSIRKCAWWCCLQGQPQTNNKTYKRIYIPDNQVFSPDELEKLMQKVREGDPL